MKRRGAMELSVGTIVVFVLGMSLLVMGVILITNIMGTANNAIGQIDDGIKDKIKELFQDDANTKLVLLPQTKIVELQQGSSGTGFALAIRNTNSGNQASTFSYNILVDGISPKCGNAGNPFTQGWAIIESGGSSSGIQLNPGQSMVDTPRHVRFSIDDNAPICIFSLKIVVLEGNQVYDTQFMDVEIVPGE